MTNDLYVLTVTYVFGTDDYKVMVIDGLKNAKKLYNEYLPRVFMGMYPESISLNKADADKETGVIKPGERVLFATNELNMLEHYRFTIDQFLEMFPQIEKCKPLQYFEDVRIFMGIEDARKPGMYVTCAEPVNKEKPFENVLIYMHEDIEDDDDEFDDDDEYKRYLESDERYYEMTGCAWDV